MNDLPQTSTPTGDSATITVATIRYLTVAGQALGRAEFCVEVGPVCDYRYAAECRCCGATNWDRYIQPMDTNEDSPRDWAKTHAATCRAMPVGPSGGR